MTENKLIAEFMGGQKVLNDKDIYNMPTHNNLCYGLEEIQYHNSWDLLMPVIHKIKVLVMEDNSDKLYNSEEWDNITHTLVQIEIKCVYQAVIKFIKQLNN